MLPDPRHRWPDLRARGPRGVHNAGPGHDGAAHHRQTALASVSPFAVAEFQARLFELLPNTPLTTGQVDLLKTDNMASGTLPGLRELDIHPTAVEAIVPTYLGPAHKMEETAR
jgi:hypothetical protein